MMERAHVPAQVSTQPQQPVQQTQPQQPVQQMQPQQPVQQTQHQLPQNEQISWPNPMEINLIRLKDPDDLATIKCRIKHLMIPSAIIDSGASIPVITKDIVERLGLEIDKNNIYELTGDVFGGTKAIGTVYNVPVTIEGDSRDITVDGEFAVVEGEKNKPFVLLGVPWLYKAGWDPIVNREFKIIHNGREIIIPLSIHKSTRRRVFTVNKKN